MLRWKCTTADRQLTAGLFVSLKAEIIEEFHKLIIGAFFYV